VKFVPGKTVDNKEYIVGDEVAKGIIWDEPVLDIQHIMIAIAIFLLVIWILIPFINLVVKWVLAGFKRPTQRS
jgi:hypothetical protein